MRFEGYKWKFGEVGALRYSGVFCHRLAFWNRLLQVERGCCRACVVCPLPKHRLMQEQRLQLSSAKKIPGSQEGFRGFHLR